MSLKVAQFSKVLCQVARTGLVVIAFFMACSVNAADIYTGFDAYKTGDYKTAFQEWKPLAEQGDADAQYWFGELYLSGQGVNKDLNQAFKWIFLSAEQGYESAQFRLGAVYLLGIGGTKNYKQAAKWFRLAAEQGHLEAQEYLKELLKGSIIDWNLKERIALALLYNIDESITTYITTKVSSSTGGDRNLYFDIKYDNLKCEITKDSKKPTTSIWYFNSQAIKMLTWCKKHSDSGVYTLSFTPKSNKGRNFVVSAFRKAPSAVSIKIDTLDFKMSAKGFTKVWNSISSEAL